MFLPNFKSIGFDSFFNFLNSFSGIASNDFLGILVLYNKPNELFGPTGRVLLSSYSNLGRLMKLSESLRSSLGLISYSIIFFPLFNVLLGFKNATNLKKLVLFSRERPGSCYSSGYTFTELWLGF